jgi:cytochrome c-type biogenesis protein
MTNIVAAWYSMLSRMVQGPVLALQGWIDGADVPVVTVILLGVLGSLSPCQLTTNLGALAYAAGTVQHRPPLALAAAYVAGKVSVYFLAGLVVMLAGLEAHGAAIPVAIAARKALGPLMIVVGLAMLGVRPLAIGVGHGLATRLAERWRAPGLRGAYLLGVAFSFALCPTLVWLFFGLTLPLALRTAGGWAFPGLFAIGGSLPLLAVAAIVAGGLAVTQRVVGTLARGERILRRVAGVVLVLAGAHDTVVYWLQ